MALQSRLEKPGNDVELGYLNDDKKVPLGILGIGLVKWDPKEKVWIAIHTNTSVACAIWPKCELIAQLIEFEFSISNDKAIQNSISLIP